MEKRATLRVMTYNVHRCVGTDRRLSLSHIADVIAQHDPDVVALQELDIGHKRTDYDHQPRLIAEKLGMNWLFHPAMEGKNEHYGDAILSRHPLRSAGAGRCQRCYSLDWKGAGHSGRRSIVKAAPSKFSTRTWACGLWSVIAKWTLCWERTGLITLSASGPACFAATQHLAGERSLSAA